MSLFTQFSAPAIDSRSRLARVVPEQALDRYPEGLTYVLPEGINVDVGDRVLCPLGHQRKPIAGWVIRTGGIELLDGMAPDRIKPIASVDPANIRLPRQLITLGEWIAAYYCCPLGITMESMLPAAVRKGIGRTSIRMLEWTDRGAALPKDLHSKQRAVIAAMQLRPLDDGPIAIDELRTLAGVATAAPIDALVRRGILAESSHSTVQAKWNASALPGSKVEVTPTAAQQTIVNEIGSTLGKGFSQHLLFGVTGSGKTEVYLQLIRQLLAQGKTTLVLVPEIALTPQTSGRLLARLPGHIVSILHSGLTQSQRHEQWLIAATAGPKVVIGARSAVFAPVPDQELGLIIVDEEHDTSYKQDQAPRYHGRDTAIRRAQLAGCPIVLGSATPSLESWHNATIRKTSQLHRLEQRAPGLSTPTIRIVDFREEQKQWRDKRIHLIGPRLEVAIRETLARGAQVIVLLNRRGYANWIACASNACTWTARCDRCDAGLIVHRSSPTSSSKSFVRCHHCLQEQRLPSSCPDCKGRISVFGLGTQRVEDELSRLFPSLISGSTMLRVDSDTMDSASHFHDAFGRFADGSCRVLLGTQMIAKGLDFPGVGLVGVISADTALNLPDFRASERTFQLVSQVAGRCGRGESGALAVIQTFAPDAEAIQLAAAQNYPAFATSELALRERFQLPPAWRMARIVVRHQREDESKRDADSLASAMRGLAESSSARILGGSPCPITRINEQYRHQVEIFAPTPVALSALITAARRAGLFKLGERMAVDVDPVALL